MRKFPNGTGIFFIDVDVANERTPNCTYAEAVAAMKCGSYPVVREFYPDGTIIFYPMDRFVGNAMLFDVCLFDADGFSADG